MKLVSMEFDQAEAKAESSEVNELEAPKYPYGTCLYLDEKTLDKLGISEMPDVGTMVKIEAMAKVTGTSEREYEGGSHKTLDLQLTDMGLEEGAEEEEVGGPSGQFSKAAKTMYGGK